MLGYIKHIEMKMHKENPPMESGFRRLLMKTTSSRMNIENLPNFQDTRLHI